MKEYIYIELLKEITNTKGNEESLNESLMVWGNHDFLKIAKCDKGEPIFELKQQYSNNHSKTYEGVEHQPLFLMSESGQTASNLVNDLIKYQEQDFDTSNKPIYIMSLIQLDYFCETPNLKKRTANQLISRINNLLKKHFSKVSPDNQTHWQIMINLGESDIVLLFKTNNIESVANAMSYLRQNYVVVKSFTLLIFPYRYNDINKDDVKKDLIKNLDNWLKRKDGSIYPLVSNFVIDRNYQEILKIDSIADDLKLLFGDYDIQLTTTASSLIENDLTISNAKRTYRYSKTSILLDNDLKKCYLQAQISDENKNQVDIELLYNSFKTLCTYLKERPDAQKWDSVINSLESSQKTFINLYNYFISLHETRYASDIYIHIRPIFNELTEVLAALIQFCEHEDNTASCSDVIFETELHIKSLLKHIQEFLGIISLSTRTFSDAHGSYMRSANAALKLIGAYHTSVYLMHGTTRCKFGNDESNKFERNKCAVLILPSRDASPMNKTMFTQLTPEHHISVIEANFDSLFKVQKMLFFIAHEVGHFSGERERVARQPLFINAAVKYMLYREFFEDLLLYPHDTCIAKILENEGTKEEKNAIESLDLDTELNSELKNKCVQQIAKIGNTISNILQSKILDLQKVLLVSVDSCRVGLKYGYLSDVINTTCSIFDESKDIIFSTDDYKYELEMLCSSLVELYWHTNDDIIACDSISDRIKWIVNARTIEENSENKLYTLYDQLFRQLDMENLRKIMIDSTERLFEDVYSDIYAIRLLQMDIKDYVSFLLSDELKPEEYSDSDFLMRIYAVIKVYFKKEDDDIIEMIKSPFENKYANSIECMLRTIIDMRSLILNDVISYAKLIVKNKMKIGKAKPVRDFYKNPNENLYEIWVKGLERYNDN